MPSFSQYIEKKRIKPATLATKSTREMHYISWEETLIDYINQIKPLLPKGTHAAVLAGIQKAQNDVFLTGHDLPLFIKRADAWFQNIKRAVVEVIIQKNRVKPLPIPPDYPFANDVSGVAFQMALINDPKGSSISLLSEEHSVRGGSPEEAKETLAEVRRQVGGIAWLVSGLAHSDLTVDDIIDAKPHGEAVWLVRHQQALLAHLANPIYRTLPALDDELWHKQLTTFPRLQFTGSKSCCPSCQYIFTALRHKLSEMGVNIPMVFFADSPYNKEQNGSVYILKKEGGFFNTGLQCMSPKVAVAHQALIIEAGKLSVEDIAYLKLNIFGTLLLPHLMKSRFRAAQFLLPGRIEVSRTDSLSSAHSTSFSHNIIYAQRVMQELLRIPDDVRNRWKCGFLLQLMRGFGDVEHNDLTPSEYEGPRRLDLSRLRLENSDNAALGEVSAFYQNLLKALGDVPLQDEFTGLEEELAGGRASVMACTIM